jgi:tRNA threonylcarbamoyladenosine biosynthesis protein TsaB
MGLMQLLALDTSLAACSVALWRDGTIAAAESLPMAKGQAEALVPLIQRVCAGAGTALSDVDAVGVTRGPGTFTGVRIGLATARGLALANGCPVIGVSTLVAIAATAALPPGPGDTLVVQDARRGEVYAELIDGTSGAGSGPMVLPLDNLAATFLARPLRLVGSGAALAADRLTGNVAVAADTVLPDPARVAALAAAQLEMDGAGAFAVPPRPLYLRAPDAKLPTQ